MTNNDKEKILLNEKVDTAKSLKTTMGHFYAHMMKYTGNPAKRTKSWVYSCHNGYIALKDATKNDINFVNASINDILKDAFNEYETEKNVEPDIALNMVKSYFPNCENKVNDFFNGYKIKQFLLDKTNNSHPNYIRSGPTKEELLDCINGLNWN